MSFFTIALKDIKIRLFDRKGFVMMLLMPIILTAILGSALSGVFGENGSIPKTTVGIVVLSPDDLLTDQFIHDVLQGDELKESLTVKQIDSKERLQEEVEQQRVDVGLFLPAGWGEGLANGDVHDLTIYHDPEKEIQSKIIQTITTSFVEKATSVSIATGVLTEELATAVPASNQKINIADISMQIADELTKIASSKVDAVTAEKDGKEPISGMQYYAAAMAAMFLLFNITIGAKSIIQERKTETLARLLSSPIRYSSIIFGKFLGTLYYSIIQFFIFVLTTHFLFGVNWGNNLLQIVAIGLAYSISVAGFSMIIAGLLTEEKTADSVGGLGIQILALLGGSMVPLTAFPEGLQRLANIAPNKWALNSFLEVMNGTTWNTLALPIAILILSGLIALILGSLKLKVS
ncbi:ABC transporter permease [Metabacillus niabensis]|uniref:ABC-2 type transport system permease protein n=1 Tax=Metabacillus niabensis TaxID=324854 RepID=A0ABT9Z527_9BACI|nr:ABC transporter permease [Metabacillus niabensis]MDQ0226370.1 ABC-2 type transport system permease protein [Metabacillus niabensis]